MANGENQSDHAMKSPAELHKGSSVAFENVRWYIAECKETRERTLRTMLQKDGYEAYVASQVEIHVYKSRNRRKVEKILLPCRVFIRTTAAHLNDLLQTYSSIYRFQLNRAGTSDKYGHKPFAYIPDEQMQQLQYVLGQAENPVFFTVDNLQFNQKVRVMRGVLAGIEGWFWQKGSTSYIVIKVEMGISNYVYTEVPIEDVQLIG